MRGCKEGESIVVRVAKFGEVCHLNRKSLMNGPEHRCIACTCLRNTIVMVEEQVFGPAEAELEVGRVSGLCGDEL